LVFLRVMLGLMTNARLLLSTEVANKLSDLEFRSQQEIIYQSRSL
jgi:hypothetical protein